MISDRNLFDQCLKFGQTSSLQHSTTSAFSELVTFPCVCVCAGAISFRTSPPMHVHNTKHRHFGFLNAFVHSVFVQVSACQVPLCPVRPTQHKRFPSSACSYLLKLRGFAAIRFANCRAVAFNFRVATFPFAQLGSPAFSHQRVVICIDKM